MSYVFLPGTLDKGQYYSPMHVVFTLSKFIKNQTKIHILQIHGLNFVSSNKEKMNGYQTKRGRSFEQFSI